MSSQKRHRQIEKANLLILNAIRLAEDAYVLLVGRRSQGALASAYAGGEQLGKAVGYIEDTEWSRDNRGVGHVGPLREWIRLDSWREVQTGVDENWKPSLSADTLALSLDWPPHEIEYLRYMMRDTTEGASDTPPEGWSIEVAEQLAHRLAVHLINRSAQKRRERREKLIYTIINPTEALHDAAKMKSAVCFHQ